MSEIVIRTENLGKRYSIAQQRRGRHTLRDSITNMATGWGRRVRRLLQSSDPAVSVAALAKEDFWALTEVSFDVRRGERLGIIGRNGAGKSTLLKILSRITEPTSGRVTLKGRVASLLEVGTGFHPELTGRENIFLNGAVLGMTRAEIRKRFDQIVSFAEVDRFIDMPVKRYSSGMYVRLAFAVAAHLEPDILVVDEVLAVGDLQFQDKCLGKMEEVGQEGRTVLFVSHNMSAVNRLCESGLLLNEGAVVSRGEIRDVVSKYLSLARDADTATTRYPNDPTKPWQVLEVAVQDEAGHEIESPLGAYDPFCIHVRIKMERPLPNGYGVALIRNQMGEVVLFLDSRDAEGSIDLQDKAGVVAAQVHVPAPLLIPGKYYVSVNVARSPTGTVDAAQDAATLEIVDLEGPRLRRDGHIYQPLPWFEVRSR